MSLIEQLRKNRLAGYRDNPGDIKEHFGIEETVLAGGYGYRQVMELVQNGADAILECQQDAIGNECGQARIAVALADQRLYVANTGAPLSLDGAKALLQSHSSTKRGNQIGRFGIGFKSLLRLGGRIDIISRSMSMRFDPDKARELIRRKFNLPDDTPVPALRVAWDLDRESERKADPILGMFDWATTVVRAEICTDLLLSHLKDEMERFPAAFLLFLPVPVKLSMNFGEGEIRDLERKSEGEELMLIDGDDSSRWRLVERNVIINDQDAFNDATHLHARDEVPIAWAMPLDQKREEAGRFWAFFPTETPTRLPGIVNAPWKLNSDRNSLIDGEWNRLLMREAAKMIAKELPNLSSADDPGKPLDVFPRRLERLDEQATTLVENLWRHLADEVIIPDSNGSLRHARELHRDPVDDVGLVKEWAEIANHRERCQFVHHTAISGNRRGRLEELAQRIATFEKDTKVPVQTVCLQRVSSARWFKTVASTDPESAGKVLALTESYSKEIKQYQWQQERAGLEIIPTRGGSICKTSSAIIAPAGADISSDFLVDDRMLADEANIRILTDVLGVRKLDDAKWREMLTVALHASIERSWRNHYSPDDTACVQVWGILRVSPAQIANQFIGTYASEILVKRRDGNWRNKGAVLLPGSVVSEDDLENSAYLLDAEFHKNDEILIRHIGVAEFPTGQYGPGNYRSVRGDDESLLKDGLSGMLQDYLNSLGGSKKVNHAYLWPIDKFSLPYGWMLACGLVGEANARATMRLLEVVSAKDEYLASVEFGHFARQHAVPTITTASPICWILCTCGTVKIGSHLVPASAILRKIADPILGRVNALDEIIPRLKKVGEGIEPSCTVADIDMFWRALIDALVTRESLAEPWLRELWDSMAADQRVPHSLPSAADNVPFDEVHYTTSRDLARHARAFGLVVAEVSVSTGELWQTKGAQWLDELFDLTWDEGTEHDSLLVLSVPDVTEVLEEGLRSIAQCRIVSSLKTRFGENVGKLACVMWQGVLYMDLDSMQALSRSVRLATIFAEIETAGWLAIPADQALRKIADDQVEIRRREVAAGVDLPERLLRAVGGRTSELLNVIGEAACRALGGKGTDRQCAELALAILGPLVLNRLSVCLQEEGLAPPSRWGTSDARHFVADLGFPEDFAVAAESRREPEMIVSGPINLPPLHDFQEEVVEGLRELIQRGDGRRRAVVSLPTGGGKTRATVQAAVELVLVPKSKQRTILWIAQTDELCEQAVQAFRQVWANLGAESTDLRVVRLWGGHRSPVRVEDGLPVVVVASIQTLNARVGHEELAWISAPGMVVIDECHHAITKSYTGVLGWLDADYTRAGVKLGKEPPVVGLSATPFRNSRDDDESLRLARRFDQTWLPGDQESLYRDLLSRGILAKADHEALRSHVGVPKDLLDLLNGMDIDSIQIENILEQINQRLAGNHARNDLLVRTIAESTATSILCFANSVEHAEELAARLCVKGIPSAAVNGDTPRSARRYFLSKFQAGEIRVMCNFAVLSTGFDAPKTDMLVISRQVMSPIRYMQMVGRGLRGVKNGGTERCRIVTVMDNLGRFAGKHPYHYCARFFAEV